MSVIKHGESLLSSDMNDITVVRCQDGVVIQQKCLRGPDLSLEAVAITDRATLDDLIIGLMLARDTIWPITHQG